MESQPDFNGYGQCDNYSQSQSWLSYAGSYGDSVPDSSIYDGGLPLGPNLAEVDHFQSIPVFGSENSNFQSTFTTILASSQSNSRMAFSDRGNNDAKSIWPTDETVETFSWVPLTVVDATAVQPLPVFPLSDVFQPVHREHMKTPVSALQQDFETLSAGEVRENPFLYVVPLRL